MDVYKYPLDFISLPLPILPIKCYILRINAIASFNSLNYVCPVIYAMFIRLMTSIKLKMLHKNVFVLFYHTWR